MDDSSGYAVFFFPPALEVLGEAIKPYLLDGPAGTHVLCREIDTGGALIEMTLDGVDADGKPVEMELMVPSNMVRMIVSARSDGAFGFGPRIAQEAAFEALPVVGPTASPAAATSESLPDTTETPSVEPLPPTP